MKTWLTKSSEPKKKVKKKYRAGLAIGQHGMYEIYGSTVEDDEEIFDQLLEQCKYSKDYSKENIRIVNFVLDEKD